MDWGVFWFFAWGEASGDAGDFGVPIWLVEEGYGLAARGAGGIGRGIHDAMEGGDPAVVGPAGHEVADIDDEALRNGGDWLPLFLRVEDFQAAGGGVGAEDC